MAMGKKQENMLHLGADLDRRFVSKFRKHCRAKNFKQLALIRNLVQWWLDQDNITQEHIYYDRLAEVAKHFARQVAIADENAAAQTLEEPLRTHKVHKRSKSG